MPEFPPFAHVAVTVTDLERSTRWYRALLAAEPVLDEDEQTGGFHHTVFALSARNAAAALNACRSAAANRCSTRHAVLPRRRDRELWPRHVNARSWRDPCALRAG